MKFVNRIRELQELSKLNKKHGLIVLFGRRRVGKTRLITHWAKNNKAVAYTQAIEGSALLQLGQIYADIKHHLKTDIEPKSWTELFNIIDLHKNDITIVIDEFPYLVNSDPSLPSVVQKWLDHKNKKNITLVLSGSSTHMMNDIFLNTGAPLFGRALKVLKIEAMDYYAFCDVFEFKTEALDSFLKYSTVGGIPKYWEFVDKTKKTEDLIDELYFGFAPYMENEPARIVSDEMVHGTVPLSILESIGRGAQKPSEIASKLGTSQTNISRSLQILIDASLIRRERPYGESQRATKKVLYKISDPTIRFWFSCYSPHRSTWHTYTPTQKRNIITQHAGTVFEDFIRSKHPDSFRYWEKDLEFDLVYKNQNKITVGEIKFKYLETKDKKRILYELKQKWNRSKLSKQYNDASFTVIDMKFLSDH